MFFDFGLNDQNSLPKLHHRSKLDALYEVVVFPVPGPPSRIAVVPLKKFFFILFCQGSKIG